MLLLLLAYQSPSGFQPLHLFLALCLFHVGRFLARSIPFSDTPILFHDRVVVVLYVPLYCLDFRHGQDRHDLQDLLVGIILPQELLDRLHLKIGDELQLTETRDGIFLTSDFLRAMVSMRNVMHDNREVLRKLAE